MLTGGGIIVNCKLIIFYRGLCLFDKYFKVFTRYVVLIDSVETNEIAKKWEKINLD